MTLRERKKPSPAASPATRNRKGKSTLALSSTVFDDESSLSEPEEMGVGQQKKLPRVILKLGPRPE